MALSDKLKSHFKNTFYKQFLFCARLLQMIYYLLL